MRVLHAGFRGCPGLGWNAAVAFWAAFVLAGPASPPAAAQDNDVHVQWSGDFQTLNAVFKGHRLEYPADMLKDDFPPAGAEPDMFLKKEWPIVAMRAKWTTSLRDWPAKYQPNASDLVLMFACDAQLYEYIFPGVLRSSRLISPPEFVQEAQAPLESNLTDALRGKEVKYSFTAKAGFGASDYQMTTKIRLGASADGKTIFYCDSPQYISDYLKTRDYFFACSNTGDVLRFEGVMLCVCTPAWFKDTTMDRVGKSGEYFVKRMYELLKKAPSEKSIDDYLLLVKSGYQSLDDFLKRHGLDPK